MDKVLNNQGINILTKKGLKYGGENYDELRNVLKLETNNFIRVSQGLY